MAINLKIPNLKALKGMLAHQAGISPSLLAAAQAEALKNSYKHITKRSKSQLKRRKLARHTR